MQRPISYMFHLIAGTSTGGILALGLAKPGAGRKPQFTAKDMCDLYLNEGTTIFHHRCFRTSRRSMRDRRTLPGEPIERILELRSGDTPVGRRRARPRTGRPWNVRQQPDVVRLRRRAQAQEGQPVRRRRRGCSLGEAATAPAVLLQASNSSPTAAARPRSPPPSSTSPVLSDTGHAIAGGAAAALLLARFDRLASAGQHRSPPWASSRSPCALPAVADA